MSGLLPDLEVDIANLDVPVFKSTVKNIESLATQLTTVTWVLGRGKPGVGRPLLEHGLHGLQ
jgi:hypothetical protein